MKKTFQFKMPGFARSAVVWLSLVGTTAFCASSHFTNKDWFVLSAGASGLFDTEKNPALSAEYRFARNWKGVHPWAGLGWATDGAIFAGLGALYTIELPKRLCFFTAGFGPGFYERHEGVDLGSHLEFCSFAELAFNLPSRHRLSVRLMHISNGGVTERNPGNELLLLGYAMPLP